MKINSTKACETTFEYEGQQLRLWIITGGTPAMSFADYSFTERYPVVEKWSDWHWGYDKYEHQIAGHIVGPMPKDVLPCGLETVKAFLAVNLPLKQLREQRIAAIDALQLPQHGLTMTQRGLCSKPRLDKANRVMVCFKVDLKRFRPVVGESSCYGGRCEAEIERYANPWWKRYAAFANPLFDSGIRTYEALSETQFQTMLTLLKEYAE